MTATPSPMSRPCVPASLRAEERWTRAHELREDNAKASCEANAYDQYLAEQYADNPSFSQWNSNRALDRQDFHYLHFHRHRFASPIPKHLEIIASKITHITAKGEDGYFHKLERNIGWTPHIVPMVFTQHPVVDKLVRCGLWSSASNSRRCHRTDLCSLCLWNDVLKVQVAAFGRHSGAFRRARKWWSFTLSYTTNPANSKCSFKTLDRDDLAYIRGRFDSSGLYGGYYDRHPVAFADATGDQSWAGMEEARVLWLIGQQAVESMYPRTLDGYRFKLEGAFSIVPMRGTFLLPHVHAVGNSSGEDDGEFIAETLYEAVSDGLDKHSDFLSRDYFPDVKVFELPGAAALERCLIYLEKVVPIGLIVAHAMSRPSARLDSATWNPAYVTSLRHLLHGLIDDLTEYVFRGFKLYDHLVTLRRRKAVGNMTFRDNGTGIGREPMWHRRLRHTKRETLREYRKNAKKTRWSDLD